jgi:hypothetical protein
MILTDKGNRKPKEPKKPTYQPSTFEELEAKVAKMLGTKPKPGLEYILDLGCECGIILPEDVKEESQEAIWFYENIENHDENCMYAIVGSF